MASKITPQSKVHEIYEKDPQLVQKQESDIAAWQVLQMPTNLQQMWDRDNMFAKTSVGLWAADLTDWLADCHLATQYCDYQFYVDYYDGWALGQAWYIDYYYEQGKSLFENKAGWIMSDNYVFVCWEMNGGCTGIATEYYYDPATKQVQYGHWLYQGYAQNLNETEPKQWSDIKYKAFSDIGHDGQGSEYYYGFDYVYFWSQNYYDNGDNFTQVWPSGDMTFWRFMSIDDNDRVEIGS